LKDTKWKLVGIVDVKTGAMIELESKARTHIFYFDSDSTAAEIDIEVNRAYLILSPKTYIYLYSYAYILIEDEFYDIVHAVDLHELEGDELRLFYNEKKNYLLYKLV
jgi:hypothetical protein